MQDLVLISIPEAAIINIVEQAVRKAFEEYDKEQKADSNKKTIFNFLEGCKYIGISKSHGYKLTSQAKVPFSKRGKRIYFDKVELDKWLLSNKIKDASQIEAEAELYLKNNGI